MQRVFGALSVLLLVVGVAAVGAHARLMKSVPASNAVLTAAPSRLYLWFNERIEARYSRLSVVDAGGNRVDHGDVTGDPAQPTALSVGLPPLAPGLYTVHCRVLSVDSHIITQQFTFTIQP